jgi:hypothetical protein
VLKAQPQLRPFQPPQQAHLHPPFADSPICKMRAVSGR